VGGTGCVWEVAGRLRCGGGGGRVGVVSGKVGEIVLKRGGKGAADRGADVCGKVCGGTNQTRGETIGGGGGTYTEITRNKKTKKTPAEIEKNGKEEM